MYWIKGNWSAKGFCSCIENLLPTKLVGRRFPWPLNRSPNNLRPIRGLVVLDKQRTFHITIFSIGTYEYNNKKCKLCILIAFCQYWLTFLYPLTIFVRQLVVRGHKMVFLRLLVVGDRF